MDFNFIKVKQEWPLNLIMLDLKNLLSQLFLNLN